MALPVAVQLYSVRTDMAEDFRGTLEKVKALGYDGVEFAGLFEHTAEEVKAMCEEIGLIPLSAHVPFNQMVEDETLLEAYAKIGCKFVAIPSLDSDHRPSGPLFFTETVENTKKLGARAKELGMTLLYHNHDFEFVKLEGGYGLDVLYSEVSADLLETELDTCWIKVAGENPAAYVRKYAGRCPVVHLKDFAGQKSANMYELIGVKTEAKPEATEFEFRPVGSGVQSFPEILKAAEESGATWVVVEQDKPSMGLTPMESIQKSREYLRTLGY